MTPGTFFQRHKLYRSRTNRVLFGVCGALADYFDFNPTAMRVLAALLIFLTFPFGLIVYIVLGFVMKPAPDRSFANVEEEDFYYAVKDSPSLAIQRIRRRFEQLDKRLQRMEDIVTSRHSDLDEEFRKLSRGA